MWISRTTDWGAPLQRYRANGFEQNKRSWHNSWWRRCSKEQMLGPITRAFRQNHLFTPPTTDGVTVYGSGEEEPDTRRKIKPGSLTPSCQPGDSINSWTFRTNLGFQNTLISNSAFSTAQTSGIHLGPDPPTPKHTRAPGGPEIALVHILTCFQNFFF